MTVLCVHNDYGARPGGIAEAALFLTFFGLKKEKPIKRLGFVYTRPLLSVL